MESYLVGLGLGVVVGELTVPLLLLMSYRSKILSIIRFIVDSIIPFMVLSMINRDG